MIYFNLNHRKIMLSVKDSRRAATLQVAVSVGRWETCAGYWTCCLCFGWVGRKERKRQEEAG